MDNPGGGGTTAVVQFDLNGPEAERVVLKIMRRVGTGYGIKLSIADSKVLTDVLYGQAMRIQILESQVRGLQEIAANVPEVVKQGSERWWKPSR